MSQNKGNAKFYTVNMAFPIYEELLRILIKEGNSRNGSEQLYD